MDKKKHNYWVYIHTTPSKKRYVGISTAECVEQRWLNGKGYINNAHFYRAIKKYGWGNIKHVAFKVHSFEAMCENEVELIKLFNTTDPNYGYNHTPGGDSVKKIVLPETREKIRKSLTGRKLHDDKWRSDHSMRMKGGGNSRAIKISFRNKKSGKVVKFECLKDAAKFFGYSRSFNRLIKRFDRTKLKKEWEIIYE